MPSTSPGREPAVKQFTDAHDCVSAQPQQPPTGHEHQSMEVLYGPTRRSLL